MKARLLYIFLLISFTASAQVDTVLSQFNATINLYASSGTGPTFTIQGIINNTTGQYDASDVAIGDIIFASEADRCVRFRVDNVTVVGQAISATVTDLEGVVTNVPLGIAMIARETANNSFPLFVDGVSADLLACVRTHFTLLVDNIEGEQGPPGADTDSIYYTLNDSTYLVTKGDTIPLPTLLDTAYAIADTLYFIFGTDTTEVLITDTDQQNLSLVADSLLIERGTGVDLSVYRDTFTDTNTDTDSIYFDNRSTIQLITRGDTIALPPDLVYDGDSSITNELQDIDSVTLDSNVLTVYISNGASASVDLSAYSPTDRADTSGYNLTFYIQNDSLNLTDGIGNLKVDLSPYLDNTDTDSILVDSLGTLLVKNRGDVITLIPDTDTDTDEQNLSLVGDSLLIERGAGVDLSGYLDNTDTDTLIVDSAGVKTYTVTRNGTIYIPAGDGTGTDTSGYNQSFTKVGDSLILVDGTTRFAVYDADSVGGFVLPTDSITFNNNEAGPNEAELNWDETLGYLVFGGLGDQLIQIGQDQYWMTVNQSGDLIEKGEVVMAVGATGNSGKFLIEKYLADGNTDPNYLLGVAAHDIPDGTEGYVMHQGKIRQIDLTAYTTGQVLYVSPTVAGDWVTTEPSNGYQKLPIAFVVDSSANGTLAVRVKTGEALRDLHDVDVSSPADGSLIAFDSVLGYWVTKADSVIDDDADSLNEIQVISKSNDTVYLSKNGGFILDANIDSFYINYYGVTTRVAQGDTFYIKQDGIYPDGYVHCGTPTVVNPVTSTTGAVWMDRNLGASQVATSSTDANSYGDLFQWGRFADGHQCRDSDTTSVNATTAVPNDGNVWDGKFILENFDPFDWLNPQNDNLWQGVNGVNNPCPSGYRLPTETELNAERLTWSSNNSAGAYSSPLKFPVSGYRNRSSGALTDVGSIGLYWSSSVSGSNARDLLFISYADLITSNRTFGLAVRCIKNDKTIGQNGIYDNRNDSLNATVKEIGITEQLSFDNSTLVIDGENNRVGIGTASPSQVLDVVGDVEIDGKIDLNDGGNSVFIGTNAGLNDDGDNNQNVGVGYRALYRNTTGYRNTATGYEALFDNTTGNYNTATGQYALFDNTTGYNNTATGYAALYRNTTGYQNTATGYRAGMFTSTAADVTLANNSIFIGYDARPNADIESNQIVIGYEGRGEGSNSIKIGNSSHTGAYIEGIKGQTTTNGANVHITADGRLMESTTSVSVFDSVYSVGDSLIFITPTPDTFIVTFQTQTDDWGTQVVQSDATLDGTGVTGDLLTLAQQSATDGQVLKWDNTAGTWLPANDIDTDTNTDEQDIDGLAFNTGTGDLTVGITNGSSQTIDLDGRYLEAEVDGDVTNEIQVLSKSNDTIYLSNGGGFVLDTDTDTYLTSDSVKLYASEMVTGNTETLINVTYDAVTQTFDFVVDNDLANYDNSTSNFLTSEVDGDATNELQNLSLVGDSIKITNGTGVYINGFYDNTDTSGYNSALSLVNDTIYLTDGNGTLAVYVPGDDWGDDVVQTDSTLTGNGTAGSPLSVVFPADEVYDGDSSVTNEIQTLSWSAGTSGNDEITLSNGGLTVTITDDVNDADADSTNEIQNLSIDSSGRVFTISIENGNFVTFEDQVDDADASATNEAWTIRDDAANTDLISNGTVFFNGVGNISTSLSEPSPGFFTLDISSSDTSELQTLNAGDYMQVTGDGINTPWEVTLDTTSVAIPTNVLLSSQFNKIVEYPNSTIPMTPGQIIIYDTLNGLPLGWWPVSLSSLPGGTDDQTITDFSLGGDDLVLSITIEDGNTDTVDLSVLKDGNGLWDSQNEGQTIAVRDVGVFDSLKFDTSTLVIDAVANQIGINTLSPAYDLDVNGRIGLGSNQALYYPFIDDADFAGSVVVGNGGQNLSNSSGAEGAGNTFVGWDAGEDNTIGFHNTFLGNGTGKNNVDGSQNTLIGHQAGGSMSYFCESNTLIGDSAGYSISVNGDYNTLISSSAGKNLTTGRRNNLIGYKSGFNLTSQIDNTMLGHESGLNLVDGNGNTFLGYIAGKRIIGGNLTSSNNSIFIGYGSQAFEDSISNAIAIGFNAIAWGDNSINIGNTSHTSTRIYGIADNTTGSSSNVYINPSTDMIQRVSSSLRYKENIRDYNRSISELMQMRPVLFQSKGDDSGRDFAGFIAEEIDEIGMTEFVDYDQEGRPDAIHYANMNALLVKSIQDQQKQIQDQQKQIEALINRIEQLENR